MTTYNTKFVNGIASLLTVACLAGPALAMNANTLPSGGTVVGGTGSIVNNNVTHVETVTQTSKNMIANYDSFSVGSHASVVVNQTQGNNSNLMARVTGAEASQIDGRISANGNVWLVNGAGINFGPTARVNVGGLVASTVPLAESDADFIAGKTQYAFKRTSADRPGDIYVDKGAQITAKQNGLVAMVAPSVENDGTITAYMGRVNLGSGDAYTLDLYGDGLINVTASDDLTQRAVQNRGVIVANGGTVKMTAATAKSVIDSLVNVEGLVQADTVGEHNGKIILSGSTVGVGDYSGSDTLRVRGEEYKGETGGSVSIQGKEVYLCCGKIDATGKKLAGTGQVTIDADLLSVDKGSEIKTNGNVTIRPLTQTTNIKVAEGNSYDLYDGKLHVSRAVLNAVDSDSITIGSTSNTGTMKVYKKSWDKDVALLNGSGGITIEGQQTMNCGKTFLANTVSGNMTIGSYGGVDANYTKGDAITLAASGGKFINNAGSDAVQAKHGRWVIYSLNPNLDTFGGLNSGNYAVWGKTYDGTSLGETGNRYVFAYTPTVTVTPGDLSKTYGENATAKVAGDTYTVTGLMKGYGVFKDDTAARALSGTAVFTSTGSPASANAGAYDIVGSGLTGKNGYTVSYGKGTLTVNKATLMVTADNITTTYGTAPTLTSSIAGFVNGETLATSGVTGAADLATTGVHAGTYAIVASQGSLAASNYTFAFANGALTIKPYDLKVTADNKVMLLNGPVPSLTYTYAPLVNGDTASVFSGSLATTATSGSGYGKYPITQGTLTAGGDYNVVFTNGTLTVADFDPNDAIERSKGTSRKGPVGTLLAIVNTNVVPTGTLPNLPDLAPHAGGNGTSLADLAPAAGGNSITPLIQCNEATPCDINQ